MTPEERMVEIFREIFGEFILTAGEYGGGAERYATYETTHTGTAYADDRPQTDRILFMLAIYAPAADRLRYRLAELRQKLLMEDFTFPEMERDGDAVQQIWLLTFHWAEDMEWQD